MSIMNFGSLMGSVVVTVDVSAEDLFATLLSQKSIMVRIVYNLAVKKGDEHIALFPQLSGGIELRAHNLGGRHILRDAAYAPFAPEAIYVEAEVAADFQADNGGKGMTELNSLHAGDYASLVCLSNPGDGPKAYLMSGACVGFLDQLREVESASRASSSDDKAAPVPVPAEAIPSSAPSGQSESVPMQAPPLVPSFDYGEPNLKNSTSGSTPVLEDSADILSLSDETDEDELALTRDDEGIEDAVEDDEEICLP